MSELRYLVSEVGNQAVVKMSWGEIVWLAGEALMPGAEQTFGVVTIYPNMRNPLHAHPNCEELLYVISGRCEHRLGNDTFELTSGGLIRIPRGTPHWAKCLGWEPLIAVISFSSPDRCTENVEGADEA